MDFVLKEQRSRVVFTLREKWSEGHSGKAAGLITSCKGSSGDAEEEQAWASCPKEGEAFQTVTSRFLVLEPGGE